MITQLENAYVENVSGVNVRTIHSKKVLGGSYQHQNIVWDGKNNAGQNLSSGKYFIVLELTGVNGTK